MVRYNEEFLFNIFSKRTLASLDGYNLMSNNGLWNYNSDWFREIDLLSNIKLEKNKFFIDVSWTVTWSDGQLCCFIEMPQKNYLSLREPKKY